MRAALFNFIFQKNEDLPQHFCLNAWIFQGRILFPSQQRK